jgi:hypothetical protein
MTIIMVCNSLRRRESGDLIIYWLNSLKDICPLIISVEFNAVKKKN